MKHKVSELLPPSLDRAAWLALKLDYPSAPGSSWPAYWMPSTDWEQGGPIIDRERIAVLPHANGGWAAWPARGAGAHEAAHEGYGATALIAAMRAYVASKFGEEVELP